MPTISQRLETATETVEADSAIFDAIVNGPASGAGSQVTTGHGLVDSVARAIAVVESLGLLSALGDTIYGGAMGALTRLAGNTTTTKKYLSQTGTGSASAATVWAQVAYGDISGLGNMATQSASAVAITGGSITGLTTPSNPLDAATKGYVDGVANGLDVKQSVQEATIAALPANTYNNGSSGVGATLTGNSNGALSVDSVAVSVGDRVLVMNEGTASHNGIYMVTATGGVSAVYVLTRTIDFNLANQVSGAFTFVELGTVNAGGGFVCPTQQPVTIGTTSISFTQFSGAGEISAGTGLSKAGNILSISTSYAGQASITQVGVVAGGAWQANIVQPTYGGTGASSLGTSLTNSGAVLNTIQGIRTNDAPQFLRIGLNQAADATASLVLNQSIGVTSTDGFIIQNTTAATSGNQQWSPRLRYSGQGWKTATTAASQTVDYLTELRTLQSGYNGGSNANPSGYLTFSSQINGAGFIDRAFLDTLGNFGAQQIYADDGSSGAKIGGGQINLAATAQESYVLVNWYYDHTVTDAYLRNGAAPAITFAIADDATIGTKAGDILFQSAPTGTAGTHITWTNIMQLRQATNCVTIGPVNSAAFSRFQVEKVGNDTITLANSHFYFGDTTLNAGLLGQQTLSAPYGYALQVQNPTNNNFFPLFLNPKGGHIGVGTIAPNASTGQGTYFTVSGGTTAGNAGRGNFEAGTNQADMNNVLVGSYRFFAASNTGRASGQNLATFDCYMNGPTANDRGGDIQFWVKRDGGVEGLWAYLSYNGNFGVCDDHYYDWTNLPQRKFCVAQANPVIGLKETGDGKGWAMYATAGTSFAIGEFTTSDWSGFTNRLVINRGGASTLSGSLTSTATGVAFAATSGTTQEMSLHFANTGGDTYFGIEDSTGGTFGGTAYATVIFAPSEFDVVLSAAKRLTVTTSELVSLGNEIIVQRADNTSSHGFYLKTGSSYDWSIRSLTGNSDLVIRSEGVGTALTIAKSTLNTVFGGSIATSAPAGGTSGAWKTGILVTAAITADLTKYIQLDIGGTLYKLVTAS
jgi:hypothetical protein